jgi:hypothetical protein
MNKWMRSFIGRNVTWMDYALLPVSFVLLAYRVGVVR